MLRENPITDSTSTIIKMNILSYTRKCKICIVPE